MPEVSTTQPGYVNRNGQIVIRNTDLPGTDHLQTVYQLGCSACGHILDSLTLDGRLWTCPECGTTHDRDVNAAKNILAVGLTVSAYGETVRPAKASARDGASQ